MQLAYAPPILRHAVFRGGGGYKRRILCGIRQQQLLLHPEDMDEAVVQQLLEPGGGRKHPPPNRINEGNARRDGPTSAPRHSSSEYSAQCSGKCPPMTVGNQIPGHVLRGHLGLDGKAWWSPPCVRARAWTISSLRETPGVGPFSRVQTHPTRVRKPTHARPPPVETTHSPTQNQPNIGRKQFSNFSISKIGKISQIFSSLAD